MKPLAIACVLLLAGIAPGAAEAGAAKHGKRCKHRTHRCATLKRVRVREPLTERLSAVDPGGLGGGSGGEDGSGGGGTPPLLGRFVSVSAPAE